MSDEYVQWFFAFLIHDIFILNRAETGKFALAYIIMSTKTKRDQKW